MKVSSTIEDTTIISQVIMLYDSQLGYNAL